MRLELEVDVLKPFTEEQLKDRELIIKMLRYEDKIFFGENDGQAAYRCVLYKPLRSLEPQLAMQRHVLTN